MDTFYRSRKHVHTQITIDRGKCTRKNWKIKYINEPVSRQHLTFISSFCIFQYTNSSTEDYKLGNWQVYIKLWNQAPNNYIINACGFLALTNNNYFDVFWDSIPKAYSSRVEWLKQLIHNNIHNLWGKWNERNENLMKVCKSWYRTAILYPWYRTLTGMLISFITIVLLLVIKYSQ